MEKYILATKTLFAGPTTGISDPRYTAFITNHNPAEIYQNQLKSIVYPTQDNIEMDLMFQLSRFRTSTARDDKGMLSALIVMNAARVRIKWIDDYYQKIEGIKIIPDIKNVPDLKNIITAPIPIVFQPEKSVTYLPYDNLGVIFTPLNGESAKKRNIIVYAFDHTAGRFEHAMSKSKYVQLKRDYPEHNIVILEFGIGSAESNAQETTEFEGNPVIKFWYIADPYLKSGEKYKLLDIIDNEDAKKNLAKIIAEKSGK